jgi:NTP pyrophosphatase (non-canonical NTP hydrolase)
MIDLRKCQELIIENKRIKNYIQDNPEYELLRSIEEAWEAIGVTDDPDKLGEEIADSIIFLLAAAKYDNVIDIEKSITRKIEKNKLRYYKTSI